MADQSIDTLWRDGVPISARFDDPYYSLDNGVDETRHVFVQGNDLPQRFARDLHIAELGFGTGLSFLVALEAWLKVPKRGRLHFTSFEAYPLSVQARAEALAAFTELAELSALLIEAALPGPVEVMPRATLEVILGDARDTLPNWPGCADAWFLDGFSPAKNPELWEEGLLAQVAAHTRRGGSFATYSAAGHVRRALAAAGFEVTRAPGFGRKRHMSRGIKR